MTNKTPSGTEKHHESTEPESSKMTKMFSFFSLLQTGWLNIVWTSRWFMHETAAFYMEQCTTPLLLHNFEVSQGVRSHWLEKLWLPVWDAIFFIYMCTFQPSNNS